MQQIAVNISNQKGKIKPMHSVNNGPAGSRVRGTSNFEWYKAAGIPFARNHDASFYTGYGGEHTVDIHRIFKCFDADETLPESYSFESTDKYLSSILEAGTQIFYRLGASIEHDQKYGTYPPKDFQKWARICEHVIRHYNEGWAEGFHMDIAYWELWNEPDCGNADGTNPCWQGTQEQFIDLFTTALRHLKGCFPKLKIGGPAFCSTWNDSYNHLLFTALREQQLPLDFFSFHGYSSDPSSFSASARKARETLDHYGLTDTEIILNEWNYIRGWLGDQWKYSLKMEKSLKGASFITASLCEAQDSPMDHFMYYDARPCGMNGMFDTDTLEPLKGYYPFPMFNTLYQLGTWVESTVNGDGLYAVAGTGDSGSAVLLTYFDDCDEKAAKQVEISFSGLPAGNAWKAAYYLLDGIHDGEKVREEIFTASSFSSYLTLPLHGVCLIKLEPAEL